MKVVITGGCGNVARYVIDEMRADHELVLFDSVSPGQARFPFETSLPFFQGDLTNLNDCRRAFEGAEAIIHLGAIAHPTDDTFRVDVLGTYYVMEAARQAGVSRVTMASSLCATGIGFRLRNEFLPEYLPVDEAHPTSVEDNYSLSKRLNEETMAAYSRAYGVTTAAFRLAGVSRPDMLREHAKNYPTNPAFHIKWLYAYVDIRDVARAFRLATDAPALPEHGVYFISAADTMSREDSAELAKRYYPSAQSVHLEGRQALLNWHKAEQTFDWRPQHSWIEFR